MFTDFHKADWMSCLALFFSWIGICLLLLGQFNWGILFFLAAFVCDLADGWLARKEKTATSWGVYLDSTIDIVTYVFFSALLLFLTFPVPYWIAIITSFSVIFFGCMRLFRFMKTGIQQDTRGKYYQGVTVVHLTFIIITLYYFLLYITEFGVFACLIVLVTCPFLLSHKKVYKPQQPTGLIALAIMYVSLALIHLWK